MNKVQNNKAWWLVLPVFLLVAFSAVIPMMTVVNYSVQDIFDQSSRYFVGADWYKQVLLDPRLHDSLLRQFIYSACVLLIEIPLGIAIALTMPTKGRWSSLVLIVMAIPLLIPWNVVGTIWQIFGRADIGLLGYIPQCPGHQLQLCGQHHGRLGHRAGDGRVALDVAGGVVVFLGATGDPGCVLPGGAD